MIFIVAWPMDLGSVCMNSQVINFLVSLPFALSVVRYLADIRNWATEGSRNGGRSIPVSLWDTVSQR